MRRLSVIAVSLLALAPAVSEARARSHKVRIAAPQQFDFTLAWLNLRGPASGLRVDMPGAAGLTYVAAAQVRSARRLILVLVVNRRPRGSLAPDPASVLVRVTTRSRERAPAHSERVNILANGAPGIDCSALHGRPAFGSELRALLGGYFGPFHADEAVARGLDQACGMPIDSQFERQVRQEPPPPPP